MIFDDSRRCVFYAFLKKFRKPETPLFTIFVHIDSQSLRQFCQDISQAGITVLVCFYSDPLDLVAAGHCTDTDIPQITAET